MRDAKKRIQELAAALQADPSSIAKRLELAAALREAGRLNVAIDLYRGVAEAYAADGRLVQAMAVCKGILEIDPAHRDTLEMLATLAHHHSRPRGDGALPGSSLYDDEPEPTSGVMDAESLAGAPQPDTDPTLRPEPLDFPPETKRAARGHSLIDLPRLDEARDTDRMKAVVPAELDAPGRDHETRAGTARALEAGRPAAVQVSFEALDQLSWDDDPENRVLADVLQAPFPPPGLSAEPPPFPLLSDLPRGAFLELLARLTVLRLEPGTMVLREGEAGDACYLIASGQVRVLKNGIEVAQLGPGAFFGEFAVLADQRRHASVEVVEAVELLEIRRALLDQLVAAHPGVARTLRRFYRERLLSTLLATAPFFAQLESDERVSIAQRFRPRRFGRGAHIIDEGAAGGGLYLILVGEVEIVRGAGGDETALGRLGEGSYFGEMSLLKGGVASATVRAVRMTEVVQLPPRDFYEVVSQHPVLWEQLRSEAERREMANHALLTGEARQSGDGSVYLL